MATRAYAHLAPVWDFFMTAYGFKRGLSHYLARLPMEVGEAPKCLDVGTGTGVLAFALLERFRDASVLATDLEPHMLREAKEISIEKGIPIGSLRFAMANVNKPEAITLPDGSREELRGESFDVITASGVLEYADLGKALPALISLLKPGGYLVAIPMRDSLVAEVYGKAYSFRPIKKGVLKKHLGDLGASVTEIPLKLEEFPANITRTGILARKK